MNRDLRIEFKSKLVRAWYEDKNGKLVHFAALRDDLQLRESLPLLEQLAFALELESAEGD